MGDKEYWCEQFVIYRDELNREREKLKKIEGFVDKQIKWCGEMPLGVTKMILNKIKKILGEK